MVGINLSFSINYRLEMVGDSSAEISLKDVFTTALIISDLFLRDKLSPTPDPPDRVPMSNTDRLKHERPRYDQVVQRVKFQNPEFK